MLKDNDAAFEFMYWFRLIIGMCMGLTAGIMDLSGMRMIFAFGLFQFFICFAIIRVYFGIVNTNL